MQDTMILFVIILVLLLGLIGLCIYNIRQTKRNGGRDVTSQINTLSTKDDIRTLLDDNDRTRAATDRQLKESREETNKRLDGLRDGISDSFVKFNEVQSNQWGSIRDSITNSFTTFNESQSKQWDTMGQRIDNMSKANTEKLEGIRTTVDGKLTELQAGNEKKLDEMRGVVDEKLNKTLNERFSQSFKQVLDELEKVYKSLGEVNNLSKDMVDIKNIFKNVKTRGTWGEIQLGSLLEQMLTPEQYTSNIKLRKGSDENVEFAIKLPGPEDGTPVWLPIDSKFPMEDYDRMMDAVERGDADAMNVAAKALEARVISQARSIRDKYIYPPATTEFAILFVPVESLFAEILRRPGLSERLQQEYRVTVAGPTTLAAILNSFRMGFRTLAIQKSSGEVWKLLGAVKKQFGTFGKTLSAVERNLDLASKGVKAASERTDLITRRLDKVQELDIHEAKMLLPLEATGTEGDEILLLEQEE